MSRNAKEDKGVAMQCELIGLRNLKITHNWRIELDSFEIEQDKVKQLVDMIGKPVSIGIIPLDE